MNAKEKFFATNKIDTDLVETAALAHDLGHPPFGHNGEEALDDRMADYGGFEGNAQTLRILGKLEKKRTFSEAFETINTKGDDIRAGLNLTARTLGAVLKYDSEIPRQRKNRKAGDVRKGYYYSERDLVAFIKGNVATGCNVPKGKFKTLECSIMDIADDIAYSTYDIEDALKGGFTNPIEMISADRNCLSAVAATVQKRLDQFYSDLPKEERVFTELNARDVFIRNFALILHLSPAEIQEIAKATPRTKALLGRDDATAFLVASAHDVSEKIASDGYRRTQFTSDLVGKFINGIEFIPNATCPSLSLVRLRVERFKEVETFKVFAYESLINSSRLKLAEFSGKSIVQTIFDKLYNQERGYMLLPEDFRDLYQGLTEPDEQARVVCDFVAGMTDRYAVEFYSRLTSPDKTTLWKPL